MARDTESNHSSSSDSEDERNDEGLLRELGKLNVAELRTQLKKDKVYFDNEEDRKPTLQARAALSFLGCLKSGDSAFSDAFEEVGDWCSMTKTKLIELLEEEGLDTEGSKWDLVQRLIENEFVTHKSTPKKSSGKGKSTQKGKGRAGAQTVPKLEFDDIHPSVMNMIVSAAYIALSTNKRSNIFNDLSGYSKRETNKLLSNLNEIPEIRDNQLSRLLAAEPLSSPMKALNHLCEIFGSRFVFLHPSHRLPGFPENTVQFAVLGSTGDLSTIVRKPRDDLPDNVILFHGMPLAKLLPTLLEGFERTAKGLTMSAEPNNVMYAQSSWTKNSNCWKNTPFEHFGALLGCEVVGQETPITEEFIELKNPGLATIRYLFLIPPPVWGPARSDVEVEMLDGIKAIQKGEGRNLDGRV